jgi:hypothetical protein
MEPLAANEAVQAFTQYTQAFQSLDPLAPAKHFHFPALMASPEGVFVLSNEAAVEQAYRRVMGELKGMGYARSVFPGLKGRHLSPDLAVVEADCIWEKEDGKELRRFGVMYTLRRVGETWKILSALIYPAQR